MVSFLITLPITLIMEALFQRGTRPAVQFSLAFLGACAQMAVTTVLPHLAMGTPALAANVAPSLSIGTLYSVGLLQSLGLKRNT